MHVKALFAPLLVAIAVACAPTPGPVPDAAAAPSAKGAGRIIGARVGVLEHVAACGVAFPRLRGELAVAVEHWRWRNEPLVARVRERFLASLAADAERRWFEATLAGIAADLRASFSARPDPEAFCRRLVGRLDAGREDVGFKYRADVEAWLGAGG